MPNWSVSRRPGKSNDNQKRKQLPYQDEYDVVECMKIKHEDLERSARTNCLRKIRRVRAHRARARAYLRKSKWTRRYAGDICTEA